MCSARNIVAVLAIAGLAFVAGRSSLFTTSTALAQQPPAKDKTAQPPTKDKDKAAPPADMSADPRMAAMMKAGMPGEHHKALETTIGKFEGVVRFKMDPKGEWMESKGTVEREWVLNKHYIRETVHATSDMGTFEGIGYLGYNNVDGQYEFVWLENESTAIMFEVGTFDPDKKVLSTRSLQRDPLTAHVIPGRGTWDMSNPDRHTYAGYSVGEDGREFKSFEGVFERVKK